MTRPNAFSTYIGTSCIANPPGTFISHDFLKMQNFFINNFGDLALCVRA